MKETPQSKPKATIKETATSAAGAFMKSSVRAYLAAHPGIKTFDDLLKTVADEAKKALDANPERYLTQEQITKIKGDK